MLGSCLADPPGPPPEKPAASEAESKSSTGKAGF